MCVTDLVLSGSEATICINRQKLRKKKTHKSHNHIFTSGFNKHTCSHTHMHTKMCMQYHYQCSFNPSLALLSSPTHSSSPLISTSLICPSSPPTLLFSLPSSSSHHFLYFNCFILPFPNFSCCAFLCIHVKQHMNKACHYCSKSLCFLALHVYMLRYIFCTCTRSSLLNCTVASA